MEVVPGVVAATGGSLMLGGIIFHERRRDAAMRASREFLGLRFPVGLDVAAARAALDGLSGLSQTTELVAEVQARAGSIGHGLWVPAAVRTQAQAALTGAMPGLSVRKRSTESEPVTLAVRLYVLAQTLLSTENPEAAGRVLLTGLSTLRGDERVTVRYVLRPGRAGTNEVKESEGAVARERERLWRTKTCLPGFRVNGLVLVRAGTHARARELADHVLGCVRSRRGVIGGVRTRTIRTVRSSDVQPRIGRSDGWLSTPELLGLLAWPLGSAAVAGVEVGSFREIAASTNIPTTGRLLFVGRDVRGERDIALSATSARQHVAVLGPTGAGKSAVLARTVLDDLSAGYGGVVIDPKDLVDEVLDRIPAGHADRIAILDPADPTSVPGLDLFGTGDPELRSDAIFSAVRKLSEGWGPRIDQFLRLGLRTVAELPNPTLSDWLRLYSDPALRRQAVAGLDPIRRSEWADYEALTPAAQREFIAPAASRITSLLSRPGLRAVLNQPEPKLDIARLLAERKWLFVRLAPGTLGEPAARVLGAIVTYLTWAAIEGRVALPPHQRHPVFLYLDELQSLTDLPMSLERFFERTRGLGCGVTVATQTLKRLPDDVRASLLGNVGTLITFAAGKDEAKRIAGELPGLSATDIQHLGSYQVAARVHTEHGTRIVTGRTEPLPRPTGQARAIRALSAERYGVDPSSVDAEIQRRFEGKAEGDAGTGRTGRRP